MDTPNPKEESFGKLHVKENRYTAYPLNFHGLFFSDMLANGTEVLVVFDL